METVAPVLLLLAIIIAAIFAFAPRPKLNPAIPPSRVPADLTPPELAEWLRSSEQAEGDLVEGAEATIEWFADPVETELCFLYLHGFSATRQETAPLTSRIAGHFGANIVYARLAGHGTDTDAMQASAEDWLQSTLEAWEIASRIGRKVVIIGTSTGAPLAIWLNEHVDTDKRLHALMFLAPNFRIRNPFGFLLTWPWAEKWVPHIVGHEHSWEPENELAAKYWTHRYTTQAVIEMQKVVDWVGTINPQSRDIPLATLYMDGDPTINADAAVRFHDNWQAPVKQLTRVTLDEENPQHVFAGDITAPHRTDWCVKAGIDFLESIPDTASAA